ncbi:MAG TPA: hypothetical protein VG710_16300 [Opitutus sp.]|nr:hypothetical protein [Opitutus sp.]
MTDVPAQSPAPRAPLVTILAVFVLFLFFVIAVWLVYLPRDTGPFPDDGIHTAAQRKQNLAELRAKHAAQLATYGWVDQKAGVVQLPIERAMELTIQKYAKKQ